MTKQHFTVIILGCSLFLLDVTYGIGWLLGWLFTGLLRHYREDILNRLIDFDDFSTKKYIAYLVLVIFWISTPLLISFLIPEYINTFAVFGAIFADRILMFFLGSSRKKEAS